MHSGERKEIGRTKYTQLRPIWSAVFMDIFGMTVLMPLALFLRDEWSRNPTEILLLMSTNAVFTFIFGPILGKLSDKYGRKPLLLISQFGTFSAFLIFAFAPNIQILYLSRAIDGIFGGNFPIAKAIVVDVAKADILTNRVYVLGESCFLNACVDADCRIASLVTLHTTGLVADAGDFHA